MRDARADDDESGNAETTKKDRNVNDYRDCAKCEKLKDENQKLRQTQDELQTKLRSIKRRNAAALIAALIPALIGVGVFMVLSSIVHGVVTAPKEPPKPIQCADALVSRRQWIETCREDHGRWVAAKDGDTPVKRLRG